MHVYNSGHFQLSKKEKKKRLLPCLFLIAGMGLLGPGYGIWPSLFLSIVCIDPLIRELILLEFT